jgi:hypothetical protein
MNRLINAYRKCPSPLNRAKLQKYLDRHMMAVCLASADDIAFLKTHEFKI